jgi:hypothetical protein
MTAVVAATASVELEQRLAAATGSAVEVLPPGPLPSDLGQLLRQLGRPAVPGVVVLDCDLGQADVLALATRLSGEPGGPRAGR